MNLKTFAIETFEIAEWNVLKAIFRLKPNDFEKQIKPKLNPIRWIIGHLTMHMDTIFNYLCLGKRELSQEFRDYFTSGIEREDEKKIPVSYKELVDTFLEFSKTSISYLYNLAEHKFNELPENNDKSNAETVSELIQRISLHFLGHTGQIYQIKRVLGKGGYFVTGVKKKNRETGEILTDDHGKPIRYKPNKKKKWVDLNRVNQVHKFLEYEFEKPLLHTVNEIIKEYGKALVIWIHGIDDDNLTPDNTEESAPRMDALIGIGQGNPDNLTAKTNLHIKMNYYPNWRCYVNGEEREVEVKNTLGLPFISINLNERDSQIILQFEDTQINLIGKIISFSMVFIVIYMFLCYRYFEKISRFKKK